MQEKLINVLKEYIVFPKVLLTKYKDLNINSDELIILIYLINCNDDIFDPKKIADSLSLELIDVMNSIESLISKDIIEIKNQKINNIRSEYINLDPLYNKLSFEIINKKEEEKSSTIYDKFEEEFGRTLSPMEYQIISSWLESDFSEEIIIEALKEAVYNGVFKLNYIDKILYEWQKKGIKDKNDIDKRQNNFKSKPEKKELYDYNWLEDDE